MATAKSVGRTIGVLLLVQGVAGVLVNFVLLAPVLKIPPGYLVNAAANALQVSLAALVSLATGGAVALGIAITAFPLFRQHSERWALWFVALSVVCFALVAVENIAVMSMLSLSQAYANATAGDAGLFQALGAVVGSARKWTHYSQLIVASGMLFVLYSVLYRFVLIPRAFAALGLVGVLLQLTAFTMVFFGYRMMFLMILPLGLVHLALVAWLITKGFPERQPLPE